MLLHRLMTLGHIVASTKLGLFGARKRLNPEEFLNRHGVEVKKFHLLDYTDFLSCVGDERDPGHCGATERRSYNGGEIKKRNLRRAFTGGSGAGVEEHYGRRGRREEAAEQDGHHQESAQIRHNFCSETKAGL